MSQLPCTYVIILNKITIQAGQCIDLACGYISSAYASIRCIEGIGVGYSLKSKFLMDTGLGVKIWNRCDVIRHSLACSHSMPFGLQQCQFL